jgi:thioredoxin
MATVQITEENFEQTITENPIVVLDFWAEWCGPCRSFAPVFEAAAEKNDAIVFGKINTEEQQGLAGAFGIRSIPTLMVFRDEIPIFQQPGALRKPQLDDLLKQVEALDMDEVRAKVAAQKAAATG